jgi:uncharacterized protein YprB with RNaseH-like and TPR domain
MSTTLERLRRLQALRPQQTPADPAVPPPRANLPAPAAISDVSAGTLEQLVPGEVVETSAGCCYVRTVALPLAAPRGPQPLGDLLAQQPALFAPLHPNFGLHPALDYRRAIFLDTETTGLGNGAGVYCFMVGVGTFEILEANPSSDPSPSHFVVRQFFMRHPGEEGALLLALADLLERHEMSVTFNGRTFDLPLLRARLRQNQAIYPDLRGSGRLLNAERPHLDLLHPARKLWRRRLQSCRLIHLEEAILGLRRTEEDVPGHLIPQLYHDYVRDGNAQELRRVFYHNLEDILSMVALAERMGRALSAGDNAPLEREDWLSLGRCYEDLAQWPAAEGAYRRALESVRDPAAKAAAFHCLGQLLKRQQRWAEAAELWELWLTSVPGVDPTPYAELAKYCEWQLGDLEQAEMWTAWAIHNLRSAPAWQRPPGALADLEHRLARLQRKRGAGSAGS